MAFEMSLMSSGFTKIAALPATSGIEETLDVMMGTSQFMASKSGIPKPSKAEI